MTQKSAVNTKKSSANPSLLGHTPTDEDLFAQIPEVTHILNPLTGEIELVNFVTGEIVCTSTTRTDRHIYTAEMGEIVASLVRSGKSLTQIGKMDQFPSVEVILAWKRKFPEFKKLLNQAIDDRNDLMLEYMSEKCVELVETPASNLAMTSVKAGMEGIKWIMERISPDRYSSKPTETKGNVTIIIDTGIRRDNPPSDVEVQVEKHGSTENRNWLPTEGISED